MIKDEEIIDCLQLINSESIGPITFYKLLETYKTPAKALDVLSRTGRYKLFSRSQAEQEFKLARAKNVTILTYEDDFYPESLRQLEDAPPILYVLGNVEALQNTIGLSIVGARNASINGRKAASRIAYELANNNINIISGMARGIDASAHKGAMHAQEQSGVTIAVLGTGVDIIYPKENKDIYEQIQVNGAIISEFPLGSVAQTSNFPRRNRIVSALGLGTLVVEATLHSGSLITARMALEQGKDIFAIPGSPNDARSQGPNKLIKDGANLVEGAEDIMNILSLNNNCQIVKATKIKKSKELPLFQESPCNSQINKLDKVSVIDYLNHEGVYVDEIIRMSGMSAAEVAMALLDLELCGRIERQPGNMVALIGRTGK